MKKIRLSIALALLLNIVPTAQAQVCTREYAPVCGQVPGESVAQTFSNRCLLKGVNAKELAQGQCAIEQLNRVGGDTDGHGCTSSAGYLWNEELTSCVRPWLSIALTLEVAAHRRPCHGLFEKQCLVVREAQDSRSKNRGQAGQKWEPLFDEIVGAGAENLNLCYTF
jgi:hypothetical protein